MAKRGRGGKKEKKVQKGDESLAWVSRGRRALSNYFRYFCSGYHASKEKEKKKVLVRFSKSIPRRFAWYGEEKKRRKRGKKGKKSR